MSTTFLPEDLSSEVRSALLSALELLSLTVQARREAQIAIREKRPLDCKAWAGRLNNVLCPARREVWRILDQLPKDTPVVCAGRVEPTAFELVVKLAELTAEVLEWFDSMTPDRGPLVIEEELVSAFSEAGYVGGLQEIGRHAEQTLAAQLRLEARRAAKTRKRRQGKSSEKWCHDEAEDVPKDYPYGPIVGTKRALGTCLRGPGSQPRRNDRTLDQKANSGVVWVRKLSRQSFEVWFRQYDGSSGYTQARATMQETARK